MTSVLIPDSGTVSDASEHTRPQPLVPSGLFPAEGPAGFSPQAPARTAGTPGWDPGTGGQGPGDHHQERLFSEKLNAHAAPRGEPWAASLFPEVRAVEFVLKVVKSS